MTVSALRRLVVGGKLDHEFIAGKYYVTLAGIEEMRRQCRVKAKEPISNLKDTPTDPPSGLSETDNKPLALDAMNATANALIQNLQNTPSKSTTRRKR